MLDNATAWHLNAPGRIHPHTAASDSTALWPKARTSSGLRSDLSFSFRCSSGFSTLSSMECPIGVPALYLPIRAGRQAMSDCGAVLTGSRSYKLDIWMLQEEGMDCCKVSVVEPMHRWSACIKRGGAGTRVCRPDRV